jgi:antitoxin VapB
VTALSPETEQLARLVGARTGKTPDEVVREAVEAQARLAGVAVADTAARKTIDRDRVRAITRRVVSRPLVDRRTPREIRDDAWDRG